MDFFEKLNKAKGGYIFLSHSHDDIEKVREIRNSLEDAGFEPLCFYLKCLNDDSEIEDLIKREIDAREWFVFADSDNARKSKWVTLEREYITRTNSKKIITVDLDNLVSARDAVEKITHNLRVFISYSSADRRLAQRIKNKLQQKDYLVFFAPDSLPAGEEYVEVIKNAVVQASKEGCVLALLTPSALKSQWVKHEIMLAVHEGGNVIPVVVGDAKVDGPLEFLLATKQQYHLSADPTDEEINEMIDRIGRAIIG